MSKEEEFLNKLKEIYQNNFEEFYLHHFKQVPKTFRINTLLSNATEVLASLQEEKYNISSTPFNNAYICSSSQDNKKLSDSEMYLENKIYIQELSSMIPALILEPKKNENILDVCAAPGSKTTQMAAITNNGAHIVAVEKARTRFFKMKEIIEQQGAKNIRTILEDANYLPVKYPEFINYFDKILLDAPCSNEASIDLSHPSTLKYWSKSEARHISKLQKGLMNTALKMLKPGGILVYSTCTYSVEENELVLDWILNKRDDIKIEKFSLNLKNTIPGLIEWRDKKLNDQIKNAVRIIPDGNFKGFFVAKIIKA